MSEINWRQAALDALDAIQDGELRQGILSLFTTAQERVANEDFDLVVVSARRAACLYQLLVEQGMPGIKGAPVVSDRFLDTVDAEHWTWNKILVLDDSMRLGTTLYSLVKRLLAKTGTTGSPPEVTSMAVVKNEDAGAAFLREATNLTTLYDRSEKQVQDFAEGVVTVLFRAGIPFFADFPVTGPLECGAAVWSRWLQSSEWSVADVTAPLLDDGKHTALIQIPTEDKINEVLSKFFPAVGTLIDTFKVRSYVHTPVTGDLAVRFVPIAMLRPASPQALNEAVRQICDAPYGGVCPVPYWLNLDPEAKHRLVQMFASRALMYTAFTQEAISDTFDTGIVWDQSPVQLYFGEKTSSIIDWFDNVISSMPGEQHYDPTAFDIDHLSVPQPSPWLSEPDLLNITWQLREIINTSGLPPRPASDEMIRMGLLFAQNVCSVFGFIEA